MKTYFSMFLIMYLQYLYFHESLLFSFIFIYIMKVIEFILLIAHFCEHMSFLGTSKYPNENEFSSYLSLHGGTSNAYTDQEDTVYYYDIDSAYLQESLNRFAEFFISPLFTISATERELNAIENEHSKNINSDGFRIDQVSSLDFTSVH